jgi:hypothetical protein
VAAERLLACRAVAVERRRLLVDLVHGGQRAQVHDLKSIYYSCRLALLSKAQPQTAFITPPPKKKTNRYDLKLHSMLSFATNKFVNYFPKILANSYN